MVVMLLAWVCRPHSGEQGCCKVVPPEECQSWDVYIPTLVVIRWGSPATFGLSLTWRESPQAQRVQIPAVGSLLWVVQTKCALSCNYGYLCLSCPPCQTLRSLKVGPVIHLLSWQHPAHVMISVFAQ